MDWPAAMTRSLAAKYLGVSPTQFDRILKVHRIPALQYFERGERLWRRVTLDSFLTERERANFSA